MLRLLIILLFMMPFSVVAEEGEKVKTLNIALVSVESLMNDSKAAKSIKSQQEKIFKDNDKALSNLAKKIRETEEKLSKAMKDKDEEEFNKLREKYQGQLKNLKQEELELRRNTTKSVKNALKILTDKIMELIEKHGEKNDFDMILTTDNVAYARGNINITPMIMKQLNKDLKNVKLK
jgi:Skp family chaperone for outer membrane proteins